MYLNISGNVSGGHDGGTGIGIYQDRLYFEINDKLVRYPMTPSGVDTAAAPEAIVSGLPITGGRLDANTTLSYRSKSQQFETPTPLLDQGGFALRDANILWRSPGNRYEIGLHGKNLANRKYIVAGYNFLTQDPFTGQFILDANGKYIPASGLGQTGVLTAYYGNPRQIFLSAAINF